jgi:hypothetical protein
MGRSMNDTMSLNLSPSAILSREIRAQNLWRSDLRRWSSCKGWTQNLLLNNFLKKDTLQVLNNLLTSNLKGGRTGGGLPLPIRVSQLSLFHTRENGAPWWQILASSAAVTWHTTLHSLFHFELLLMKFLGARGCSQRGGGERETGLVAW